MSKDFLKETVQDSHDPSVDLGRTFDFFSRYQKRRPAMHCHNIFRCKLIIAHYLRATSNNNNIKSITIVSKAFNYMFLLHKAAFKNY